MALNSNQPPSGRPTLDEPATSPQPVSDLSDIVRESTQRLAETPQAGVQPKRGRGRPRKDGTVSQPAPGQVPPSSQSGAPAAGAGFLMPSMAPFFAEAIKMPFAAKAVNTGFDGWKLTEDEAKPLGEQIDAMVKTYMPQLDQRYAVAATFAFSLLMVTMPRVMEQAAWEKKKASAAKTVGGVSPAAPPQPPPSPQAAPTPGDVSTRSLMDAIPLH